MKKFIKVAIPIIIILCFIIILNAGRFLKKPFGKEDDVYFYLKAIENNIYEEEWDEAEENLKELEKAWDIVLVRIQMTIEGARINDFFSEMAHLRGAIHGQSRENAIIEIDTLIDVWERLED